MFKYILLLLLFLSVNSFPQQEVVYVGSKKSDKYHYTTCRWAQKILPDNLIEFNSVGEASEAGYKPCKVCKPPALKSKSNNSENSSSYTAPKKNKKTSSGRCQATTKKGTQCKRNAKAGSSYCWQHQ